MSLHYSHFIMILYVALRFGSHWTGPLFSFRLHAPNKRSVQLPTVQLFNLQPLVMVRRIPLSAGCSSVERKQFLHATRFTVSGQRRCFFGGEIHSTTGQGWTHTLRLKNSPRSSRDINIYWCPHMLSYMCVHRRWVMPPRRPPSNSNSTRRVSQQQLREKSWALTLPASSSHFPWTSFCTENKLTLCRTLTRLSSVCSSRISEL